MPEPSDGNESRDAILPAYLIAGADEGKLEATLARLRARAEREGGPGALESFEPEAGSGPPDAEALVAAIPSMSLMASRRYLLADGVERWTAKEAAPVVEALGHLPPELTIVLVARELGSKAKAAKGLAEAVKSAGGKVLRYAAPKARELPAHLVNEARSKGFQLEPEAAQLLVERLGESTLRLGNELERLALWAGEGGRVAATDLESMVADTSEEASWTLSDALISRDPATAISALERLSAQGAPVTTIAYAAARRLREGHMALTEMEAGTPRKEVESRLPMHPYAAKMLIRRLGGASIEGLRAGTCAIADLEWWTRGGSDYPEEVALTRAVRRAAGG